MSTATAVAAATCLACRGPLTPVGTLRIHPGCDISPDLVASELFAIIGNAIDNQPRSLQKRIGPSEIGIPCEKRIGHILARTPVVNARGVAWKPFVGTAVHEQFANIFARHEVNRYGDGTDPTITPRWHVEERVSPGLVLNGVDIDGSCDLLDEQTGTAIDWKITTKNKIREHYRPHGPGSQYRVQAHEYGLGWQRAGYDVRTVMIVFFTRDGDFTDRHVWSEPFDPQIALAAHDRVRRVQTALDALGPDQALPMLGMAESWCSFCPWHKRGATDLARACPGVPSTRGTQTSAFDDLLPKEST